MTTAPLTRLTTLSGYDFDVRPVTPDDEAAIQAMFEHVALEDLRFRFLSTVKHVPPAEIALITHVDHNQRESVVAIDPASQAIIASAMLARDETQTAAEVAISIDSAHRGRGVAWSLLAHIAALARQRGLKRIYSIESRDNHDAINLEREMGFSARAYPGDTTLVLVECDLDHLPGGKSAG